MSYSFSVTGANKQEVKDKVQQQFDDIVQQQPAHKADREAAQGAAFAMVDVCDEPANGGQINATVYGSLSQQNPDDDAKRRNVGATLNISVAVA